MSATMTAGPNLIQKLRAAVAGDTFHGLTSEQAESKVLTLEQDKLLKLWREALAANEARAQVSDEARAAWLAEIEREAEKARDEGRRHEPDVGADAWCRSEHAARMVKALAKINERDGSAGRAGLIGCELRARYQRDGEPAGVLALRKQLDAAALAVFEALQAQDRARELFRVLRTVEAEHKVMEAAGTVDAAERKALAVKRELHDAWAVLIDGR